MTVAVVLHGLGGRSDLPLPVWLFAYAAGFALLISFVALRILWPTPRLFAASAGHSIPEPIQAAAPAAVALLRVVGLGMFAVTVYASAFGTVEGVSNLAPTAVCVIFWVGVPMLVAVLGDLWRPLNPLDTLAWALRVPEETSRRSPGMWTAGPMLFSFVWLELAYYAGCSLPRSIAVFLVAYTVAALAGAALWGRQWLQTGEGFAALFSLLAHLSPLFRDEATGSLRWRIPCSGLAAVDIAPGAMPLLFVALGSTAFDGFSRSQLWADVVGQATGWERAAVSTVGLVLIIAVVLLAYLAATRVTSRLAGEDPTVTADRFMPSLIPIVLAYMIAHYFSFFVFEGQNFLALLSDPFGLGWDLFGTINNTINYRAVSTRTIAYVQVGSIVVGHVIGVVVAHDRAVETYPPEVAHRSQYPLLAVMVLYTVGGLWILLGG